MTPHFPYIPESLDAAKKYLATKEVYDEQLEKNVSVLNKIERQEIPKTIEWHAIIQAANHLKEQEI